MSEPDGLSPELKALLDAERTRPMPDPAIGERVLKRLEQSVLSPGGSGSATGQAQAAAVGGATSTTVWVVLASAALVAAVGVALYFSVGGQVAPAPRPPQVAPPTEPVVPPESNPPPPTPPTEPVVPAPAAPPETAAPPEAPKPARPAAPPREQLLGERELIENARAALARRKLPEAEAWVFEHFRRFPNGQLAEERDALSVNLLIAEGSTAEAEKAAKAFHARYPDSLLLRQTPWPGGFKK